jgi:hypothetical protein
MARRMPHFLPLSMLESLVSSLAALTCNILRKPSTVNGIRPMSEVLPYSHATRRLSSSIASDSGLIMATTFRPGPLGAAAGRKVDVYMHVPSQDGTSVVGGSRKPYRQPPESILYDYSRLPWPGHSFVHHRVYSLPVSTSHRLHVSPCGVFRSIPTPR